MKIAKITLLGLALLTAYWLFQNIGDWLGRIFVILQTIVMVGVVLTAVYVLMQMLGPGRRREH
jgi:tetrahydromethanopterin S-methyltransferase subunit G